MSVARRRFRFIKEIAEGGFGKVYLAEQISSDGFSRIVAIKLLHAKWSSHDEIVMRTRDEARLLGLIRHQNIVKVEDLTSVDGKCAIVMEYLEGVDLKAVYTFLRDQDIECPRAAVFEIMAIVSSALDAAFNGLPLQGGDPLRVIHRDIKPSNIFVTIPGGVKVLDFGTARADFAEREAKTQALAFGSQGYMAPERVLGEEDTPAADIFSLGITLYELLCLEGFGRIPPRPSKFKSKIDSLVDAVPLQGDDEYQELVRETLRLMLSYEPEDRPSAAQLVDIFEMLAARAEDMPLRRFCRTIVTEAKAAMPALETSDPLTGRTVDEDVSSAFGVGQGALEPVTPPPVPKATPPPAPPAGASIKPQTFNSELEERAPLKASIPMMGGQRGGGAEAAIVDPPTASGGGVKVLVAGSAAAIVVVVILVIAALIALLIFQPWASSSGSGSAAVPVPVPEVPADVPPDLAVPTPVPCVVTPGEGAAEAGVATTLTVTGDATEITVIGGQGFRAVWDGQGTCALGLLSVGTYRANVTPREGRRMRSKSFEVTAGASCTFAFDVSVKAWSGGCE